MRSARNWPNGPAEARTLDSVLTDAPVPVVVELRVGQLASRTVPAFRAVDDALLPVGALFDLAEVAHHLAPSGRLEATLAGQGGSLVIDPASDSMRAGPRRISIAPSMIVVRDGELYVAAGALGQLLDLHFAVDWRDLAVTLLDPEQLPIARRIARDAAHQRLLARATPEHTPDLALGLERPRVDGLVLDYGLTAQGNDPLQNGSYAFALGANVLGGSLEGSLSSLGPTGTRGPHGTLSWTGVWDHSRVVQQLRLGDAQASGPNPRPVRGFSIGNAPYLRLTDFGTAAFLGDVAPGWMVEAYRGGELIAFDSTNAAGQFGLQLPVEYGENAVDLIAYGPYGQIREFDRVYHIPGELIPTHHFEYGASLGECTLLRCTATGNLDLRYGLSPRWTARAGIDQFWRDTLPDLAQPYASVSGALTNAWTAELLATAHASTEASLRFEPSLGLQLTADYARYATDVTAPLLSPAGWRSRWTATALVRPLGARSRFYIDGNAQQIRLQSGTLTRAQLGASVQRSQLRAMPYVRLERQTNPGTAASTQPYLGLSAFLLPLTRLGPVFGQLWWRGSLEAASASRLASASLMVSGPIGFGVRAELGTVWTRGMHGPRFTLTFSADRGTLRSYTTLAAQPGAAPGVTQSVQGSVLLDRASGGVMFVPGPSLQRAGITGRVFLDANANGRPDPGEQPLTDVRVRVGPQIAVSDSSGTFRVWDVVPFEPVHVTVDSMSLASPLWVPLFDAMSVVPGPNRFQLLDVPIVPGGEIEGHVVHHVGAAVQGVPGVRVVLRNLRTAATRSVTTFPDGEYDFEAVPPGRYALSVQAGDLARLRAGARTVEVALPADVNGARVGSVIIALSRTLAQITP